MNDKYTTINKAWEFRVFLHRLLSENTELVELFKTYINNEFEAVSTEAVDWHQYQFRIKKSNLKKKPNFTHSVDFYYNYIDNAIYKFITDPTVQLAINGKLSTTINAQNVGEAFDELRSRYLSCRYLYTINTAPDNMVIIYI